MITVDASTLVNALVDDGDRGAWARARLDEDAHWCAPDFIVAEVLSAVRGLHRGGHVSLGRAEAALEVLARLEMDLVDTRSLLADVWRMRDAVSAYDAGYVALAMTRQCPLVTADARLARAGTRWCEVVASP